MRNNVKLMQFPCFNQNHNGQRTELVFVSSPSTDKQLKCKKPLWGDSYQIDITSKFGFTEIWSFHETKHGHVYISPLSDSKKYLACDSQGRAFLTPNDNHDTNEKITNDKCWFIDRAPQGFQGVTIKNALNNCYLYSDSQSAKTSIQFDRLAVWSLEAANRGKYSISLNLNEDQSKGLQFNNDELIVSEKGKDIWELRTSDDYSYVEVFLSSKELYLVYDSINDKLRFQKISPKGNEWTLILDETNGIILQHAVSGKFLGLKCATTSKIVASLVSSRIDAIVLSLQPSIPQSKPLIPKPVLIGGLAVAGPFAVTGAVTALGFSSAGIAAGSVGARMMSISAGLAGGGVPAGGVVATLQSVGAAGLGMAGTASATAAGAAAGMTVSSKMDARNSGSAKTTNDISGENEARVFCDWKHWSHSSEKWQ
jgi:hypothetical protein